MVSCTTAFSTIRRLYTEFSNVVLLHYVPYSKYLFLLFQTTSSEILLPFAHLTWCPSSRHSIYTTIYESTIFYSTVKIFGVQFGPCSYILTSIQLCKSFHRSKIISASLAFFCKSPRLSARV